MSEHHVVRQPPLAGDRLRSVRYGAIAATPVVGHRLPGLPGVHGVYVPVGDLVVDGCIVAIVQGTRAP